VKLKKHASINSGRTVFHLCRAGRSCKIRFFK